MSQDTKEKIKPRYWCVRIPKSYCGDIPLSDVGGFQTVVVAYDNHNAFASAMGSVDWEILPFEVTNIAVYPTIPL